MDTHTLSAFYPYDFDGFAMEKVTKGFLSENHILYRGNEKYFLKRYRFTDESEVQKVHAVKHFFASSGIPVIVPIKTKDGSSYIKHDGHLYSLFPFIKGIEVDRENLTFKQIESLAFTLASIHLLSKDHLPPILECQAEKQSEFTLYYDKIMSVLSQKKEKDNFDELAQKGLRIKKQLVDEFSLKIRDYSLPSDHLLHGDYQETNVFFNKKGDVEWVFDFEKARVRPRVYELMRSMDYMTLNGTFNEDTLSKAAHYLRSYHSKYPLSDEELSKGINFYYKERIEGLWIEKEHYLNNNTRVDVFLERNAASIEYLKDNYALFSSYLLSVLSK